MEKLKTKIRWTASYIQRIFAELIADLWDYYCTPYPFLLFLGAFRRIARRIRIIWLPQPPGRPPIHENVVDLIIDMKRCNKIWGAQRISDELKLMGIKVSKKTVLKILRQNGFVPPRTKFSPPSWTSLIETYARFWSMDFTTVFDVFGVQLFIFVVIEVPSRKLILINVTANPDKIWLMQQLRNRSFSGVQFPDAIVHDRDGIYGKWLPHILKEFGALSVKTHPHCPWQNSYVERFNLSIKTEVLNRIPILNLAQVNESCSTYMSWYNTRRPHQGIDGAIPGKVDQNNRNMPSLDALKIEKFSELNGLTTHFRLSA